MVSIVPGFTTKADTMADVPAPLPLACFMGLPFLSKATRSLFDTRISKTPRVPLGTKTLTRKLSLNVRPPSITGTATNDVGTVCLAVFKINLSRSAESTSLNTSPSDCINC